MDGRILDQVLRFHLRVDRAGRIVHLGPSLAKVLGPVVGQDLISLVETDDLTLDGSLLAMPQWPDRLVRATFRSQAVTVRGEFFPFGDDDGLIFACTLDPEEVGRLPELGLSAGDFAGSDLTMEFSMLKWARDAQVRETKSALARLRQSTELGELLKVRASTDSLTGIANRARFIEELDAALHDDDLASGSVAVIMIDVDRFKSINDLHGHQVGDQVLVSVAQNLERVVDGTGLAARIGGDEFAVLVTGREAADDVERVCRQIAELSGERLRHHNGVLAVGLSVGMAVQTHEIDSGELLRHADVAMYAGRRNRSQRFGVFDPAAQHDLDLRRSIADDLRNALETDQIELYFQPIVDLKTSMTAGFEVLSRWLHPEHGSISPELFIEVAERCQIVKELDHYVVRKAIAAATRTLAIDGRFPRLSINFSALSLTSDLVSVLAETLSTHKFPPALLCVEVTETASIADLDRTSSVLRELSQMGIIISLDDFGTGYSSLTYLHELPIGALKIDQSFVSAMMSSQKALEVIRSILHVAQSLSLPVVGEGVETRDQYVLLRNLGCQYGQGYYFARPAPVIEARRAVGKALPRRASHQLASRAD